MPGHCHKLVAKVAREAAAELYEVVMADNSVREAWKASAPEGASEKALLAKFVAAKWGACIPLARATLATLLRDPAIDAGVKEDIMEALVLDSTLAPQRAGGAWVAGEVRGRR